ncbi:MAG: hypothetical protein M0015_04835 [Betaproteobacteria bacterium]|nr:hypothetical protein [Betaproteobacteria bacterium]
MRNRLIAFLATTTLALFAGGAALAAPPAAQTSSAAGVTIQATPTALAGIPWKFEIVLTTHSGALDDDLAKSASLADGGTAEAPLAWRGDPPGGHHRKGVLEFAPIAPRPASIELRIQRAGESAPRVFRWALSSGE